MKLGDILKGAGARVSVPHSVQFTAVGQNAQLQRISVPVPAVLIYVPEDTRETLRFDARSALAQKYPGKLPTERVISDEETFHLLFHALHQPEPGASGAYSRLCDTVDELRMSLVLNEADRLTMEYHRYMALEFPPYVSDKEFEELVDEAKKKSLADLLTSYGFEKCARALTSLAGRAG